jgi:hypothetical protein
MRNPDPYANMLRKALLPSEYCALEVTHGYVISAVTGSTRETRQNTVLWK